MKIREAIDEKEMIEGNCRRGMKRGYGSRGESIEWVLEGRSRGGRERRYMDE